MKVLHLSTSDINGGAARGTYWLHQALRRSEVDSWMLVGDKGSDDDSVMGPPPTGTAKILHGIRQSWDYFPLKRYKHKKPEVFSPAVFPNPILSKIQALQPDIIHLHWICEGFFQPEALAKLRHIPIVWTLRDMWAFTGGCHYSEHCTRYVDQCGTCPHLGSHQDRDLSRQLWQRKAKAWRNLNLEIVAISHWLADCARKSSLFEKQAIRVIHNAVDIEKYKPLSKQAARELLNLPQHKKIVLFGALNATVDRRKGFDYLVSAFHQLIGQTDSEDIELVVFGSSQAASNHHFELPVRYLGKLNDDLALAMIYSAADVTVVPSIEEAFGKTAIESLACGTPVVSFDTTGLKDIVGHQQEGYRAQCFDAKDLANGILWVVQDEARWHHLSEQGRKKVESQFSLEVQVKQYLQLYQQLVPN